MKYRQHAIVLPRGRVTATETDGGAAIRIELFDQVLDATQPKPNFEEALRAAIQIAAQAWGRS